MARFDVLAHGYDLFRKPPTRQLIARANLKKNDRVLDVGGGTGVLAQKIRPLVKKVLILDPSAGMRAKAKAKDIAVVAGVAEQMPFSNASFDVGFCTDAFHHIRHQARAIKEIHRVLKPHGLLVMEEFDPATVRGRCVVLLEKLLAFGSTFWTPDALAGLLTRNHFSVIIPTRSWVYILCARKLNKALRA